MVSSQEVRDAQSGADITLKGKQGGLVDNQSATQVKQALDLIGATALKNAQEEKTDAEKALLGQKEITEYAQTQKSTKAAPDAGSIMGKQATLYGEQSKGFKWNADQKYLDTLLKAWQMNVNTAGIPSTGVDALNATGTPNINTIISDSKPT